MAEHEKETEQALAPDDPGIRSVYQYLLFGISLPERTLRSSAAMVGGALHESAELLVPHAFRDSRSYKTFVQQMLDMLAKDMGGVDEGNTPVKRDESDDPSSHKVADSGDANVSTDTDVENYVARKAVGSFMDLAGMATFHLSPLTILAIASDVAYGSKTYLNELAVELKKEGVISEDSTIDSAADLLGAISTASGETASAFDLPPLSVEGLKETIEQTTNNLADIDAASLLPESEIARLWDDMQKIADAEGVSIFDVSSAMTMYTLNRVGTVGKGALTTVRVTGNLLDKHLIDHYWQGLSEIGQRGIYVMLAESSQPYIDAVWFNYSIDRPTITEDVFNGKIPGKIWRGFHGWMMGDDLD